MTERTDAARQALIIAGAVALAALAARLPLAVMLPVVSPDGETYLTVARNLLEHGCISMSPPESGACVPHWGGNHLPGYPAFVALVWAFLPDTNQSITVVQTLLAALACGRLAQATALSTGGWLLPLLAGGIAALSPVQVAWSRFVLPDTLSVAAAVWLFAELILSQREDRLRRLTVGLALAAACLLRLDGVLLALPVAIAGFALHPPLAALRRGLVIALIVAVPLGGLTAHNVMQGLSVIPQAGLHDGTPPPHGYLAWGNTWITSLWQGGEMFYPVAQRNYAGIVIDPTAYADETERRKVEDLLAKLRGYQGRPFPADIDQAFGELAAAKVAADPVSYRVELPLRRAATFWFAPQASFGWPIELSNVIDDADRALLTSGSLGERIGVALRYPVPVFGKAAVFGYRLLLVMLTLGLMAWTWRRLPPGTRWLAANFAAFAIWRTAVLSYQTSIDNRYMIPAMAALELMLAMLIWAAARRRLGGRSPIH
jgi:hypothetical protein